MQIVELTKEIKLLTTKNTLKQEVCRVCGVYGHGAPTCSLACNSYANNEQEQVNMMQSYKPRTMNSPYTNTYNLWRRNHPNFS